MGFRINFNSINLVVVADIASCRQALLSDDFDQNPFLSFAVEFTVKNLFPVPQVEIAGGHCHHHFPAHDGALQVGVGIVFITVMVITGIGFLNSFRD